MSRIRLTRFRALLVLALALTAAFTIAACGGDDGGDEDPQEVLEATFDNEDPIDSGVFDVSFELAAEGGDDEGTVKASLGGPFEGDQEGAVPKFDVTADAELDSASQDFSGSAGIISTGDKAFVNFQDTDYEVPARRSSSSFRPRSSRPPRASSRTRTATSSHRSGSTPRTGSPTSPTRATRTSREPRRSTSPARRTFPSWSRTSSTIAERVPQAAEQVTPAQLSQLDQLTDIIQSADFDVYTGADDDILRKLEADIEVDPPGTAGAPDSVSVGFSVTLSEVNEPQRSPRPAERPAARRPAAAVRHRPEPARAARGRRGRWRRLRRPGRPPTAATQAYLDCLQRLRARTRLTSARP